MDMIVQDDNKNKDSRKLQSYVPAKIKVINISAQRVICSSTEKLEEETFEW